MSKILVTGGAGFIGSHITDKLLKNKYSVVVVDNLWLDLDNSSVNEALKIMSSELKEKIVIFFSTRDNTVLLYDKKYTI